MAQRRNPVMLYIFGVALAILCACTSAIVEDRALIAFDKVVSGPFVAGMNVTVEYTLHNIGGRAATSVTLRDVAFPSSRFVTDKPAKETWARLESGQSLSYAVQIEPRRSGQLFIAPASVTYMGDGTRYICRLAADDSFTVEELIDFRRRTDRHTSAWLFYLVAFAMLGVLPCGFSQIMVRSLPGDRTSSKKS